jgi:hypothetical protein
MNGAGENTPATVLGISRLLFAQPATPARTWCRLSQPRHLGQLIIRDHRISERERERDRRSFVSFSRQSNQN